jgi:energy-coupling factor transporter ATP-binding protein EcfA2
MKHISHRYNNYEFTFKRVNVILGANGVGKSKFLTELKDSVGVLTDGAKAVYIEGGRTIVIKDVLQLDHTNVGQFERYDSGFAHYESKRSISLASRVFDALVMLEKRDVRIKSRHSDAVELWVEGGLIGVCPVRQQPPLAHLFELFNEIFPQITLDYDSESRSLTALKNGQSYGPSGLSDGEKQVFSILADLIELEETHKLIIADEPELNLHPELAERLWTLLEDEFPHKTFIYATHSINFALRSNVECVYVLSSDSSNIAEFTGLDSLPRTEVTAFLGGLPGILSANRVLVTEGHEKSFDAIFYRWLLNDKKIEIYPGGGCADVISIVSKSGLWEKISTNISLVGVIDADFRNATFLSSLKANNVHVLPLHEAESYLCIPDVLCAVAGRIGSQEHPLGPEEVISTAIDFLARDKLVIAARRIFARSRITLAVSLERKLIAASASRDSLVNEIKRAAESELAKASVAISPDQLEADFDAELREIEDVVASRDMAQALRLLPAKELIGRLSPRTGCKNGTDLMRALGRNFKPSEFAELSLLASMIAPPKQL